jgi:hypothetical protein
MADRYDLKVARTGRDGKTYWTKIGVMFPMKERDGFNITLEALPLQTMNDQGQLECRITAWEPYKDNQSDNNDTVETPQQSNSGQEATSELNDKIPF